MARQLKVVHDDLFFAARVQAHARRLGLSTELINPGQIDHLLPDDEVVIVLQLTLNPERQLALLERLRTRSPSQPIVAVTGHLETDLRRRARKLGAILASNSAMERVLARACGIA